MQLIPNRWVRGLLAAWGLLALPCPLTALEMEDPSGSYVFRNFGDSDHVHVMSHFARYDATLSGGTNLFLQFNHEVVTVPGVSASAGTQEAVDAITTASRPIASDADAFRDFSKHRNEVQGELATRRVLAGYYLSSESDYFAQQVRAAYNRDFFEENFNLSIGSSYGWDRIQPLDDEDSATGEDSRSTFNLNTVATQILSPTMILRVGGQFHRVQGLQHNPYRNVYAGGGPVAERHPDERLRMDAFVKVSKYFTNRSSINTSYVAYHDDWGITSHTLGARLNQYITDDVLVRYRYRYYTQGAADFYREEYEDANGIDGYRTADYRLGAFNAHLFGVEFDLNLGMLRTGMDMFRHVDFNFKYERYFNRNNFSANILESGLVYRF